MSLTVFLCLIFGSVTWILGYIMGGTAAKHKQIEKVETEGLFRENCD